LDVLLSVHQFGQRAAQSICRCSGARLFAAVEHTLVAVAAGQSGQPFDVEINLHFRSERERESFDEDSPSEERELCVPFVCDFRSPFVCVCVCVWECVLEWEIVRMGSLLVWRCFVTG